MSRGANVLVVATARHAAGLRAAQRQQVPARALRVARVVPRQRVAQRRRAGAAAAGRGGRQAALNLGRNIASDLRGDGVAVGIYHPGWVRTDMGGGEADISVEEAAEGLLRRFDALGPGTSGVVEDYKGTPIPF